MTETTRTKTTDSAEFDPRDFRNALGKFPTGVTIATTLDSGDGKDVGMTINSFSAVSLEPPLILFSIDKSAFSLPAWRSGTTYGISILSEGQHELANAFARSQSDKWNGAPIYRGEQGVALIRGAIAHLECSPFAQHEAGDHVVFIARVDRYSHADKLGPLGFSQGRYSHVQEGPIAPSDWPLHVHEQDPAGPDKPCNTNR